MTADAAAQALHEADPAGSVGLVSAEPHPPYDRPPLSKALWKGEPEEKIWRKTAATGAALHLGRRITAIDPQGHKATDDRGTTYRFKKLLLATGGAFIGSEVAAALRLQQRDVTMLVPEAGVGARVFPADLAAFLVDYYRQKGVTMRMAEGMAGLERRAGSCVVRTTVGGELVAEVLVAGLGIMPGVELAEQAGLRVDNGIVVDEVCRTSQPDIYAAGDVATFENRALGARLRVEHEDNANTMGRTAGLNMAGRATPYHHLPFFYSDLFELGYEAVGDVDARLETVADWKEKFREGVVYYLKDGRVRGVLLWNTWGQVDHARALIAEPGPFKADDLKGRLPA